MNDRCDDPYSSTSARVDIAISNNGTWTDAFQFGDPDDTTWDIVGCTFELLVKLSRYDAQALLTLTTGNGRIIVDDVVQRVIHFDVDPADIQAALKPGVFEYDLVMIDSHSVRTPLMHGVLEVGQGVSYP